MPAVTSYQNSIFPNLVNGVIAGQTAAQLQSTYAGMVKTATQSFAFFHKGHHIDFRMGRPVVVAPDLAAALTVANAPVQ